MLKFTFHPIMALNVLIINYHTTFPRFFSGKGAGSLIGGYLMKVVGTRNTYRVFAAGALGAGFVYFLFNRFYLRHRPFARQSEKDAKPPSDKDHEACAVRSVSTSCSRAPSSVWFTFKVSSAGT